MAKVVNFVLFQLFWFAAVIGAAEGQLWWGPVAAVAFVAVHLGFVPAALRRAELGYLLGVTLVGGLVDTALRSFDVTAFPTSGAGQLGAWPDGLAMLPPIWILSCWLAFACLPRFSLAWLAGRPALAAFFGAVGGPLSYLAGARFGATAIPESTTWTVVALAIEYAVLVPLMLALVPKELPASSSGPVSFARG